MHAEMEGLRDALQVKKQHKKKSKPLDLQQRQEYHGGAQFWSPQKVREAQYRKTALQHQKDKEALEKAESKELKAAARLYKQKIAEEKRVAAAAAKVAKQQAKAAEAAAKQALKAAKNTTQPIQTSQKGKRKASRLSASSNKRHRPGAVAAASAKVGGAVSASPAPTSRCGRPINLPEKYK